MKIESAESRPPLETFWVALFIGGAMAAAACYSWYSTRFIPAIHDEASYLFQAQTFLMGRIVNPVHPEHLFFDQYHIINEGVYASKYFPGFALTLMPFLLIHQAFMNPIFFYGLELFLLFVIGKTLYGTRTAWFGMILTAISPQIFFQNCFLLTHLSECCFLLLCFLGVLLSERENKTGWLVLASSAWGFAFLIRPLTAVGFAFPLFIFWVIKAAKGKIEQPIQKFLWTLIPVFITLAIYFFYNKAVTGQFLKTPFDYYAEIHAPYHRYGFNQWTKYAAEASGPRVDKYFNEYYHNHTWTIGLEFLGLRLAVFIQYLFGSTALGFLGLAAWFTALRKKETAASLIFWIFLSLQLIHIPHFYPGILTFGSNYLYEVSGLVILACVNSFLILMHHPRIVKLRGLIGFVLIAACVISSVNLEKSLSLDLLSLRSMKVWLAKQIAIRHMDQAVIFVRYPAERNINLDVIENVPGLNSRIVFAHDRGEENARLKSYFPNDDFYLWKVETAELEKLSF